jgi:hypothetical protein
MDFHWIQFSLERNNHLIVPNLHEFLQWNTKDDVGHISFYDYKLYNTMIAKPVISVIPMEYMKC